MAIFERASPALKEVLFKLHRKDRPMEIDHTMHEFGSVCYNVKYSASDQHNAFLSISMPMLSQGSQISSQLSTQTLELVKAICPDVIEMIEPPKEGYQLTLKLNFNKIPHTEASTKIITEISSVHAIILSCQLKGVLRNAEYYEDCEGVYKPIKLIYHPMEPFFVIKQSEKITVIFPIRFKEDDDVIIATTFFQELMDIGSSRECYKAPHCIWSPIPPPELKGEHIEDLSTNGGFISFDITSRHVKGKKLDRTIWNLLNFRTFVKCHVKSTQGFIHRRMRGHLESLVKLLQPEEMIEDDKKIKKKKPKGLKRLRKWITFSKSKILKGKNSFINKIKRLHYRIKIHGLRQLKRRWLNISKFSQKKGYERLD